MADFMLAVDQSTQGTKLLLLRFDGSIAARLDRAHAQIVDERGWVEHDPEEIWQNLKSLVREMLEKEHLTGEEIAAIGISNQRETALAWNRATGAPVGNAIVWQCARGRAICERLAKDHAAHIQQVTGLPLSPYFSAAKLAWLLENVEEVRELAKSGDLALGTMDSYIIHRLTGGEVYATDASNASRTQLFDIEKLAWSSKISALFGIAARALPEVRASDASFGMTDVDGILKRKVPIHACLGDSHAALFGQGCLSPGQAKATYGTGSSVMMQTGARLVRSQKGLATSLAWLMEGEAHYVLEGNINYTGAAVTWLKDSLGLVASAAETEALARRANPADESVFVPAFTGLGAPYWQSEARGVFTGLSRTTGRAEMVRAVLDAIAFQIADIASLMQEEAGESLPVLRVDGGPTKNTYLMQMQADLLDCPVEASEAEELSALGAGFAAGIAVGFYHKEEIFAQVKRRAFSPAMETERRGKLLAGWKKAVAQVLWAATH